MDQIQEMCTMFDDILKEKPWLQSQVTRMEKICDKHLIGALEMGIDLHNLVSLDQCLKDKEATLAAMTIFYVLAKRKSPFVEKIRGMMATTVFTMKTDQVIN
jgi:hypothetical protein